MSQQVKKRRNILKNYFVFVKEYTRFLLFENICFCCCECIYVSAVLKVYASVVANVYMFLLL